MNANSPSPRSEYVYTELRRSISNGHYQPGQPVREAEVASRLNVSRTPVREAFRRLQADGVLEFTPWRGVVVAELNEKQIIELYVMRQVLEGTAASLAAANASDEEIEFLAQIMEQADGETNPDRLADLNRDFHQALYNAAHNRYLLHAVNALRDSLSLLSKTTYSVADRPITAQSEHREIVEALRQRNSKAAEKATREHIAKAEQARLTLISTSQRN